MMLIYYCYSLFPENHNFSSDVKIIQKNGFA